MQLSEDFLDDLAERTAEEYGRLFGRFYLPFLRAAAETAAGWQRFSAGTDLPAVTASLLPALLERCSGTGIRTLITVFRADRPGLPGDYRGFHEWVASDAGRRAVLDEFPELERLLWLITGRFLRLAEEVLEAVAEDRADLVGTLGCAGRVTGILPGQGDVHRGGRSVCRVRWENGVHAVYKPQHAHAHRLFAALRELLDPEGTCFGPLYPVTVTGPGRLWQEFVTHGAVADEKAARGYFRRFGGLVALAGLIGATDLHHENVLATSRGPVVIDPETLVSLPSYAEGDEISALARDIEQSVLNSMLLPTRYLGAKLDMDLSGIGCVRADASRTLHSFTVTGAGTDAIRFEKVPVTVEHGPNVATLDGRPLDPRHYTEDLVSGFEKVRSLLRERRAEIESTVRRTGGWAVRQVVRPTYLYARFLEASTHPAYLRSTADRERLLGKLPPAHRGIAASAAGRLKEDEVRALVDGDVPYFGLGCDEADVSGDHGVHPTAAGRTPREAALTAIGNFLDRPERRDPLYIRYALACSVDDAWDRPPGVAPAGNGRVPDLTDPRGWLAELEDLRVGRGSRSGFLMPRLEHDGLRLSGIDARPYEGGGLLLHLARQPAGRGAPSAAELEELCRTGLSGKAVGLTPADLSPFTGTLGEYVTRWQLRRLSGVREPFPSVPVGEHAFSGAGALRREDYDYLNGLGGYLAHLAAHLPEGARELTGAGVEPLLHGLVRLDGDPTEHHGDLGMAHGRIGRLTGAAALTAAGLGAGTTLASHLELFADSYLRNRWRDPALEDTRSRTGWCKGYAGVTDGLLTLLRSLGRSRAEVRAALEPEVEQLVTGDFTPDISVCHGMAGRLLVLCRVADELDWPEARTEAAVLYGKFTARYGAGGWRCGAGHEPRLPSYFLGLSGWYHAVLVLSDPTTARLPLFPGER